MWCWGFGVWVWGMGVGAHPPIPNPQSPIPNPQSPIPNPHFIKMKYYKFIMINLFCIFLNNIILILIKITFNIKFF